MITFNSRPKMVCITNIFFYQLFITDIYLQPSYAEGKLYNKTKHKKKVVKKKGWLRLLNNCRPSFLGIVKTSHQKLVKVGEQITLGFFSKVIISYFGSELWRICYHYFVQYKYKKGVTHKYSGSTTSVPSLFISTTQ